VNDRLYRSRDDRMLAGVAAGLADYWDADPSLIRVVWALLAIVSGGIALVVYIVMAIVVPEDPAIYPMAPGTPASGASWAPPTGPGSPPPGPSEPPGPGAIPGWSSTVGTSDFAGAPAPGATAPSPPVTAPYPMPPGPYPLSPGSYPMDPRSARRAARAARRAARHEYGGGMGAALVGSILVLLGVFFLAREWIPQLDFNWFWPVILIAIGVVTLMAAFVRPHDDRGGA
jgi:phage shock protein PspC (stress-responsive transcriptional regulator)